MVLKLPYKFPGAVTDQLSCPIFRMWPDEALDIVEANADWILCEIGVEMDDMPSLDMLKTIPGCKVQGSRVYLDGSELRKIVRANAPSSFTQHARDPKKSIRIGVNHPPIFLPIYGAPKVSLENGDNRNGTLADYRLLTRLAHHSPAINNTGMMTCVVHDVKELARPVIMAKQHLLLSDKPFMGSVASLQSLCDVAALTAIATGQNTLQDKCYLVHLVNSTPALSYQNNPLRCLRTAAELGQANLITSYIMMGATGPVTVAGALSQGYAEVLTGLALSQLWRAGSPVIGGIYGVPFSMQSMVPVFGDPISWQVQAGSIQLINRLGLPARGDGGVTSSKVDDAQAGSEGGHATIAAVYAGASYVLHSVGWLEAGRCVSETKFRREAIALETLFPKHFDTVCEPLPVCDSIADNIDAFVREKVTAQHKNRE